jgi:hypothetical protein
MAPAVVFEGPFPVLYESWPEWRSSRRPAPAPLVEPGTAPCAHCWGQGRIWEQAANREGLVPRPCLECLGRGRVAA